MIFDFFSFWNSWSGMFGSCSSDLPVYCKHPWYHILSLNICIVGFCSNVHLPFGQILWDIYLTFGWQCIPWNKSSLPIDSMGSDLLFHGIHCRVIDLPVLVERALALSPRRCDMIDMDGGPILEEIPEIWIWSTCTNVLCRGSCQVIFPICTTVVLQHVKTI